MMGEVHLLCTHTILIITLKGNFNLLVNTYNYDNVLTVEYELKIDQVADYVVVFELMHTVAFVFVLE